MAAVAYDPLINFEDIFRNPFDRPIVERVVESEYFVTVELIEVSESFVLEGNEMAIPAASRTDLFVAIGLPIILAAAALVGGAWMMYTRLDDKIDSQVEQVTSDIRTVGETFRAEASADRKLFTDQFEKIRSDMRQDRAESVNRHMEIINRLPPAAPR